MGQSLSRFSGQYRAAAFAYGAGTPDTPAPLVVVAAPGASGAQTLTVQNGWITLNDGTVVYPLATTAPINVGSAGNEETVTPSAVSNSVQSNIFGPTSNATATFTNAHYAGDRIASGTAGLQEAINYANLQGGGTVLVDSSWTKLGGTNAMITAAVLPSNGSVAILDLRGGSGATSQTITTLIPNAAVKTLSSVGSQLIPAPGAGNLVVVDRLVVEQVALTAAFAGSPGNLTAAYGTQGAQIAVTAAIAGTVLTGGSGTTNQIGMALGVAPANGNASTWLNQPVTLFVATNDPTTGGGSLIVKTTYRVLTGF